MSSDALAASCRSKGRRAKSYKGQEGKILIEKAIIYFLRAVVLKYLA